MLTTCIHTASRQGYIGRGCQCSPQLDGHMLTGWAILLDTTPSSAHMHMNYPLFLIDHIDLTRSCGHLCAPYQLIATYLIT